MKRWLSPWVAPLVMLGVVVLLTRPIAGALWIVVSVVLVRLLNGHFELPADDEPLRRYFEDPTHPYFGAQDPGCVRSPS